MELKATRDAYGKTLIELGREIPELVVLDADLSSSTRTSWFAREFPDRFFQMGISEADMIGTASGLAASGLIPFVSTFAIFATGRAWEQIRQSVGYPNFNVKIVATHGGISVGEDGASHQMCEDISIMRAIPNMRVFVPADATETAYIVRQAAYIKGPVYIRLSRPKTPVIFDESYDFDFKRWHILQEGQDICIFACGTMVAKAMSVNKILKEYGIESTVVNSSVIKPPDYETILNITQNKKLIVTIEEHSIVGGLGSAVAEVLAERGMSPLLRLGVPDTFGRSGAPDELYKYFGLDEDSITEIILKRLKD